jgi:hypothetical protein
VAASGVTAGAVVWGKAAQPVADPVIRLFVVSDVDMTNVREVRTASQAGYARRLSVLRDIVIQVQAETINVATAADALAVAGDARLGLELQAAQAELSAVGVHSIALRGPSVDRTFKRGEHLIAARSFDILFRAEFHRDDPDAVGVIEHVKVGGTVYAPAEIEIPETTYDRG